MPETVVAKDPWGQIILYDEWNALELRWLASTATAADADLKATMKTFAQEAVKRRPNTLLVDNTEFRHTWGEGFMQWRQAEIIPLYNQSGIAKFAFIAGANYPLPTVESGATPKPDGPANFPTGWFKTREAADRWLGA